LYNNPIKISTHLQKEPISLENSTRSCPIMSEKIEEELGVPRCMRE
jgi:hypothetical protein